MDLQRLLIFVGVIAVVLLLARGPALLRARKVRGKHLQNLAAALPEGVDPGSRLLLYFWSPSCGMCSTTTPIINELQSEHANVVSLNAVQHLDLAREAGVMGTPAFVVVDHGVIDGLRMGTRNRSQIKALLDMD